MTLDFFTAHPEIPWQQITGFQDVVVHQYERVELPRVWQIVTEDLVSLTAKLASIVLLEKP